MRGGWEVTLMGCSSTSDESSFGKRRGSKTSVGGEEDKCCRCLIPRRLASEATGMVIGAETGCLAWKEGKCSPSLLTSKISITTDPVTDGYFR